MPELRRVTVVNDSPEFLELMGELLHDASYPATLIDGDRGNAMELIEFAEPEILIIDLRLGADELKGLDILRQVREHPTLRDVPTIVCSADHVALDEHDAELRGLDRIVVLPKPFEIRDVYRAIEQVLA